MTYEPCNYNSVWSNCFSSCLTLLIFFGIYSWDPLTFFDNKKKNQPDLSLEWLTLPSNHTNKEKVKRFVEANPFVPENLPDYTNLLSSRDQQAAQPNPTLNEDATKELPQSSGDSKNLKVIRSSKLVEQPAFGFSTSINPVEQISSIEPSKISLRKDFPDHGNGHYLPEGNSIQNKKRIYLSDRKTETMPANKKKETNNKPLNKIRPKLSHDLLNGPILKNTKTRARLGKIAIDARLNPYGIYMQEMLKAIETQWGELLRSSIRYIQKDSLNKKITYTFTLLKSGNIKDLTERNASTPTSLSSELCRQAIASRAPFGRWDDVMIKEIGQSDQITITFNYL